MTEITSAAGFTHLHELDDRLNWLLDLTGENGHAGTDLEDFDETLRPTGAELDEETGNNGNDWKIDIDLDNSENDFGAGEFPKYYGKFLKWFFSSFTAQYESIIRPQVKKPLNNTNYPTLTIVVSTQTEGMFIRPCSASMEEVPTYNYCGWWINVGCENMLTPYDPALAPMLAAWRLAEMGLIVP